MTGKLAAFLRDMGTRLVRDGGHASIPPMRLASRPLFHLILLLVLTAMMLSAYVLWKLPQAERLIREKKKAAPAALPAKP